MPRRLIKLILTLALILTITNLAARALGSIQPVNPALRGFTEGCEGNLQPCWYGIVPGETRAALALRQIESKAYKFHGIANGNIYFLYQDDSGSTSVNCSNVRLAIDRTNLKISGIYLTGCLGIVLADLSLIGFPEKISPIGLKVGQYYKAEIVEHELVNQSYRRIEWSPLSRIFGFDIGSTAFGSYIPVDLIGHNWHGFVALWRYCQLEPDYRDCKQ